MALYHTHRPQKFAELIGQDHIRETLLNALKQGRVAHAYLFSGPRGSGKTSTARLLAKAVNCELIANQVNNELKTSIEAKSPTDKAGSETKSESASALLGGAKERSPLSEEAASNSNNALDLCGNKCASCKLFTAGQAMDILEMDAASNRGIDEIRDLREHVKFPPTQLKYKVVIIDEVHMLTKDAFNALLKTLEEPPSHLIFILATTEAHKISPTILSRVQRFDFKRADKELLADYLKKIARKEKIDLPNDAALVLATLGDGSFRDSVTLLDQVSSGQKTVSVDSVRKLLGLTSSETIVKFFQALDANQAPEALKIIDEFISNGGDPESMVKEAITIARQMLRQGNPRAEKYLKGLVKALDETKYSPVASLPLELFVFDTAGSMAKNVDTITHEPTKTVDAPANSVTIKTDEPVEVVEVKVATNHESRIKSDARDDSFVKSGSQAHLKEASADAQIERTSFANESSTGQINKSIQPATTSLTEENTKVPVINFSPDVWNNFLHELKNQNATLAAILKDGALGGATDDEVTVFVKFKFHHNKICDHKNIKILEKTLEAIVGKPLKIKCIHDPEYFKAQKTETEPDPDLVLEAISVFEGV